MHTHTQMTSIHLLNPTTFALFQPFPSEATPYLINAHIGTHVTQRHVSQLVYRLGPTFLFEEQVRTYSIAKDTHVQWSLSIVVTL